MADVNRAVGPQRDKKTDEAEQLKRILRRGIDSSRKFQSTVDKMPGRMIKA